MNKSASPKTHQELRGISILIASGLMTSLSWANPEINVQGRLLTIPSGNTSVRVEDNTDFGVVTAGSGEARNVFIIANAGTEPNATLTIQEVSVDGSHFSVSILPQSSVPKDGVTSFEITYRPLSAGTHNATVTVRNNDADEAMYTFAIRGVSRTPEIQVRGVDSLNINAGDTTPNSSDGTDFGTRSVLQTVDREFRIHNFGDADLVISSVTASSGPFSIYQAPASTISSGTSGVFGIRYRPTAVGSRSATITILSNDLDEPSYTFAVMGNADAPEIELSHNSVLINNGSLTPSSGNGTLIAPISFKSSRPSRSFMVRNIGTGGLLISQVTLSDSVNFAITAPLTNTITSNSTSILEIEYNPVEPGDHTCTVEIVNNDLDESPYRFSISASSLAPGGSFGLLIRGDTTPSDAEGTNFGDGIIGAPPIVRNFPIVNSGPGLMILNQVSVVPSSQFALPAGTVFPVTIPVGGSYQLPIQFSPSSLGTHKATVTIRSNDPVNDPFTFDVAGTGNTRVLVVGSPGFFIARGDMTPSVEDGTNFEFGDVGAQPRKQTVIPVKNDGSSPLTINSVTLSDQVNFTIVNNVNGLLAPGASKNLVIEFTPQSGGPKTSTVSINSNEPGSPYTFGLKGFGRPVVAFGNTLIGAQPLTANQPFTNSTSSPLTVESITIVPTEHFYYDGPAVPFVVQAGQTVQLPVRYEPVSHGNHAAVMTVRTSVDGLNEPASYTLRGSSDRLLLIVGAAGKRIESGHTTPSESDETMFGKVITGFGKSIVKTWPLLNDGNVPLTISSIELSNTIDFSVTTNPLGPIGPVASTPLAITFLPRSVGIKECVVTIHSNDPRSPFTFTLEAEGRPRVENGESELEPPVLTPVPWDSSYAGPYSVIIATEGEDGLATTPYEGGFDTFVVRGDGSFTASGTFLDQLIQLKGKIGPDGKYAGSTILPDGSQAIIQLQTFVDGDGISRIFGSLVRNGKTWIIDGVLSLTKSIPANMIGKYTFVIPGSDTAQVDEPAGDCVAQATLRIDGRFTVMGRLADTNTFTMKGMLGPRYELIFWRKIGKNLGHLSGVARFRDIPEISDFDGQVQWYKRPSNKQHYFGSGFSVTRPIIGNYYRPPVRNRIALTDILLTGFNNALFQMGSSTQGVSVSPKLIQWTANNKIFYSGPEQLILNCYTSTGRLRGRFIDPVSKSNVVIEAVMLQKQNRVAGMLYNYGITGYVSIVPRQHTGY